EYFCSVWFSDNWVF
nr:immunoglobulin light chain junction region [Macaca mulatta]